MEILMKRAIIVISLLILTLPAVAKGGRGGHSSGGGHSGRSHAGYSHSKTPAKSYITKKSVKVDSRKKPSKDVRGDSNMAPDGNVNPDPVKTDAGKADAK